MLSKPWSRWWRQSRNCRPEGRFRASRRRLAMARVDASIRSLLPVCGSSSDKGGRRAGRGQPATPSRSGLADDASVRRGWRHGTRCSAQGNHTCPAGYEVKPLLSYGHTKVSECPRKPSSNRSSGCRKRRAPRLSTERPLVWTRWWRNADWEQALRGLRDPSRRLPRCRRRRSARRS